MLGLCTTAPAELEEKQHAGVVGGKQGGRTGTWVWWEGEDSVRAHWAITESQNSRGWKGPMWVI